MEDNGTSQAAQADSPVQGAMTSQLFQTDSGVFQGAGIPANNREGMGANASSAGSAQFNAPTGAAPQGSPNVPGTRTAQACPQTNAAPQFGAAQPSGPAQATSQAGASQAGAQADSRTSQQTDAPHTSQETPDPETLPITDWSKAGISVEGASQPALDSFGKAAVELGLTPAQARGLAQWQIAYVAAERDAMNEAGLAELKAEWGLKAEENLGKVRLLIERADAALGDKSFSAALAESGAACRAPVIRGLLAIVRGQAEDSLAGAGVSHGTPRTETALEGMIEIFKKARGQ